ncbi:hypothetical protein RVIR1_00970 [Candidatus Rickettsiella viridis]|uniref:Uncharacterized protein n=1 Tax=Candidatus Rickettsiella viridis TaxID=676208 RepID=A0A2Z5UT74_9COXI|nr:hypothetical protein RVIR1_00970 [Candidatus Rickettsiella viridis]
MNNTQKLNTQQSQQKLDSQQWDFRQGAAKMKQPECIYDT